MCLNSFQVHKEKMPRKKSFPLWATGKDTLNSFIRSCDLVKEIAKKKRKKTKEKPKQQHKNYTRKEYTRKREEKYFNVFIYAYWPQSLNWGSDDDQNPERKVWETILQCWEPSEQLNCSPESSQGATFGSLTPRDVNSKWEIWVGIK